MEHKLEAQTISTTQVMDTITKKLSQEQQIPLYIVKAVINHQFKSAEAAVHTNSSIEIAGFGKFLFRPTRAVIHRKNYQASVDKMRGLLYDPKLEIAAYGRETMELKIEKLEKLIAYLDSKLESKPESKSDSKLDKK